MYKILIFGIGVCYDKYLNGIRLQEALGKIKVAGVTRNGYEYRYVDGYPFVQVKDVKAENYDVCVIAAEPKSENYKEIRKICEAVGFDQDRMITICAFSIPDFDLEKYLKIQNISIMAINCWGGFIYRTLYLPYLSPLISLFEDDVEYIKMMNDLQWYMQQEVTFSHWEDKINGKYPVGRLGDVSLHFMHAKTFESAKADWERRVGRINYDRIFAMMFTEKPEIAREFAKLPYHKVCFTSFKADDIACVHYCEGADKSSMKLCEVVNNTARRILKDYNVFDLLLGQDNNKRIR